MRLSTISFKIAYTTEFKGAVANSQKVKNSSLLSKFPFVTHLLFYFRIEILILQQPLFCFLNIEN